MLKEKRRNLEASYGERHGEGLAVAFLHAANVEAIFIVVIPEIFVLENFNFRALHEEVVFIFIQFRHAMLSVARRVAHAPDFVDVGIEPGVGAIGGIIAVDAEGGDALREEHRLAEVGIALANAAAVGENIIRLKAGAVVGVSQAVVTPFENPFVGFGLCGAFQVFVNIFLDDVPLRVGDGGIVELGGSLHVEVGRFQQGEERLRTVFGNHFGFAFFWEERLVGLRGNGRRHHVDNGGVEVV